MTVQTTIGFAADTGERTGAWDEIYYQADNDVDAAAAAWGTKPNLLNIYSASPLGRRLNMLSNKINVYYVRHALVGSPRVTMLAQGNVPGYRASDNFAGDAVCMRATSPSRATSREFRFGGLPDNVVADNAVAPAFVRGYVYDPASIVPNSFPITFLNAYQSIGGLIRYRSTSLTGGQSYRILSVAQAGQNTPIVLSLEKSGAWDLSVQLDLSTRMAPQLRGRWVVAATTYATGVATVTLRGSERYSCPPNLVGKATAVVFDTVSVGFVGDFYLAAHKLGKKKYQRVGRRSPRLLRH